MSMEHAVRKLAFKAEELRANSRRDFELDLKLRAIADACIEAANLLALRERNG